MSANLCEKHFPEPILYMTDNQPLCRKCVPEYMEKKNKNKKKGDSEQSQMIAKMLGLN